LYCSCILLFIIAEIEVKDMSCVCLRTKPLTRCHGNEASTRNCEEVVFYFPENSRDILRSKKIKDTPQVTWSMVCCAVSNKNKLKVQQN